MDDRPRPPHWQLSPWAVVTYLMGGALHDGTVISPKYVGSPPADRGSRGNPGDRPSAAPARRARYRQILGIGAPGRRHLDDSTLMIQGTSGTAEEAIRYGWNYARLIAEGPSPQALVPSPVMVAMERGSIARIEELTRIPAEVQDALIMILSEKTLPIPELGQRNPGSPWIQCDSARPTTATRASTSCPRRSVDVSTPSSCRCRTVRTTR